jgi:hypothetical protein
MLVQEEVTTGETDQGGKCGASLDTSAVCHFSFHLPEKGEADPKLEWSEAGGEF